MAAGDKAWLTVEVTDLIDDISYGSGYAHHQIGDIIRNVSQVALPKDRFENIFVQT